MPMLKIQNGVKIFNLTGHEDDKRIAMNHMNVEIKEGEWVTIIGGNGSGKSTLMNIISGVHHLDEGHVYIDVGCRMDVYHDNALSVCGTGTVS